MNYEEVAFPVYKRGAFCPKIDRYIHREYTCPSLSVLLKISPFTRNLP
jgi:hypothetical protein